MSLGEVLFFAWLAALAVLLILVAVIDLGHMLNAGAHFEEDEAILADLDAIEREWPTAA